MDCNTFVMCFHTLVISPPLISNTEETLPHSISSGSIFSFKGRFQCRKSGFWCSRGYSGLQHEHTAGAGSCESSSGPCAMEITLAFPWCLNSKLQEDNTGPQKDSKSNWSADTSHCAWLKLTNSISCPSENYSWLCQRPAESWGYWEGDALLSMARWGVCPGLSVMCPGRYLGKSCRESVRRWKRKRAGWEKVPSLLHCCISSVLHLPSKLKLGCYGRDFLVWESLSSRFPLSHGAAAVGSVLLFAQLFFFMA